MSKFAKPPNRDYRVPPAPKCGKKWYATRTDALAAGRRTVGLQAAGVKAYQCETCRTVGEVRPWHWARSLSTWAGLRTLRNKDGKP